MTTRSGVCAAALLTCSLAPAAAATEAPPWPSNLPKYDHILIVIEENKDYEQVIGNKNAPYINMLAVEGANLTLMFGEEHPSEGNYFWLFSGNNQNAGFHDQVPSHKFSASSSPCRHQRRRHRHRSIRAGSISRSVLSRDVRRSSPCPSTSPISNSTAST